jgi:uncharacterized protein (TIGR02246 family)
MATFRRFSLGLVALIAVGTPGVSKANTANVEAAIRSVLTAQGEAWNRGDLSAYLSSVARDDRTRHIFNDEITVGYAAIEARFRARYPDPRKMGTISYSDLDVSVLASDAASAFAHWTFQHDGKTFAGVFTLIFRQLDGEWVIFHDHSTAFPSE